MSDETPQKEVIFLDGFLLSVGEMNFPDGERYTGIIMEDLDKKYFMPFWKSPNDDFTRRFKRAFKNFDTKYSNIGSRE